LGSIKKKRRKKKKKKEAFIPLSSTAPAAMTQSKAAITQSKASRKRAPTIKALKAENTPKQGTRQSKGRGKGKGSTDRKGKA
jgi:hypothetical protein